MTQTTSFTAFGITTGYPAYSSKTSEIDSAKYAANKFAVAYRNTFGAVSFVAYETEAQAEAAMAACIDSVLGFDADREAVCVVPNNGVAVVF